MSNPPVDQMPPAVEVREATLEDLIAVVECQTACWIEAYTGLVSQTYLDDPDIVGRRTDRWRQRLSGERRVFVAVDRRSVVGVVSAGPSRDAVREPALELMSLYLRASYHGSGVADQLLGHAVGSAAASLWVFEDNPRARAFYVRHGFRADGSRALDEDTGVWEIRLVRGGGNGRGGPGRE